ncbi:hypothetical protein BD779DRAFT_1435476 [Infundibulicybe gibba]|nr:hypothetical protein BD779DRAFT_1435476 [Infundibulicybe gibba]
MPKRSISPAFLPPAKRIHGLDKSKSYSAPSLNISSLYDELILCIFSYLSSAELCATMAVNKNWSRLAMDSELWRLLYIKAFGRTRLRGARGFVGRSDGREIRPLPSKMNHQPLTTKDWKWMFRISSNWKRGRCTVERGVPPPIDPSSGNDEVHKTNVLLAGSLAIIASSKPSSSIEIRLRGKSDIDCTFHFDSAFPEQSPRITSMTLDQSPPRSGHLRVVLCLSTGEFSIFSINYSDPSPSPGRLTYVPNRRSARTSSIIQVAYHHPLLITLSASFTLSIYDLSLDRINLSQTLTSFTSFPPASLVLSTPANTTYKLVLAYAVPVYPSHWSVGATEVIISRSPSGPVSLRSSDPPTPLAPLPPFTSPMTILTTRTTRAIDIPQGWVDEQKLRSIRNQWHRKVIGVADTQTDGKWVVIAPRNEMLSGHNADPSSVSLTPPFFTPGMQLYRLSLPPPTNSVASLAPKLTFVRMLEGQPGPISALALADGRCVSLGCNGSIWVWDLEGGTGAQVADGNRYAPHGTVTFDDRRIVTVENDEMVIRRFDI